MPERLASKSCASPDSITSSIFSTHAIFRRSARPEGRSRPAAAAVTPVGGDDSAGAGRARGRRREPGRGRGESAFSPAGALSPRQQHQGAGPLSASCARPAAAWGPGPGGLSPDTARGRRRPSSDPAQRRVPHRSREKRQQDRPPPGDPPPATARARTRRQHRFPPSPAAAVPASRAGLREAALLPVRRSGAWALLGSPLQRSYRTYTNMAVGYFPFPVQVPGRGLAIARGKIGWSLLAGSRTVQWGPPRKAK